MSYNYETPYVQWLQNNLSRNPQAKEIALLRRGFIVQKGGIELEHGCPSADYDAFERLWSCTYQEVLTLPSWRGMSSSVGARWGTRTLAKFEETKWGTTVPTKDLDCGIAPIVKRTVNLGLMTQYCCDGHGDRSPYIKFPSSWDLELFMRVLRFRNIELLAKQLSVEIDQTSATISFSVKNKNNFEKADMIPVCDSLFEIAMAISTPQIRAMALDEKRDIIMHAKLPSQKAA